MEASMMARGPIYFVSLRGRLVSVRSPDVIPRDWTRWLRPNSDLVLDLGDVHAIDCSGIGLLVTVYVFARETDARLQLANLRFGARRMLEVCGLLEILRPSECEESALAGLIGPERSELYMDRASLTLAPALH
jgi:anti-anti-sigma factor